VAEELVRALGRVLDAVEEGLVVGRPEGVDDVADVVGQILARAQVFDLERVLAVAGVVDGVGEKVPVVRDGVGAEAGVLVADGQLVQVERDLFGRRHTALLAREDGVLLTLDGARVVEVAVLAVGHLRVGLLDARVHLLVERLLEGLGRLHHGRRVGVLGFEVGGDFRVRLLAHPEVFVNQRLAVDFGLFGHLFRDGR
jgi:hypothetical protein